MQHNFFVLTKMNWSNLLHLLQGRPIVVTNYSYFETEFFKIWLHFPEEHVLFCSLIYLHFRIYLYLNKPWYDPSKQTVFFISYFRSRGTEIKKHSSKIWLPQTKNKPNFHNYTLIYHFRIQRKFFFLFLGLKYEWIS